MLVLSQSDCSQAADDDRRYGEAHYRVADGNNCIRLVAELGDNC
jgi:hypothetical protein